MARLRFRWPFYWEKEGVFLDRLAALVEMWARSDSDQPDLSWAERTLRAAIDEERAK